METIVKVKSLSKFGFFVEGEDKGLYFDRSLLEADRGRFVPGAEIPVILRVAESGTKYVTAISHGVASRYADKAGIDGHPEETKATPVATPKTAVKSEVMSKADWNAKDRSMMVGGLSHDSASLVNTALAYNVDIKTVLTMYEGALSALLTIRENVK